MRELQAIDNGKKCKVNKLFLCYLNLYKLFFFNLWFRIYFYFFDFFFLIFNIFKTKNIN